MKLNGLTLYLKVYIIKRMKNIIIIIFLPLIFLKSYSQDSITVIIQIPGGNMETLDGALIQNDILHDIKQFKIKKFNTYYKEKLPLNKIAYFGFSTGETTMIGLVEPNDSLLIKLDTLNSENFSILGKGKEKFQLSNEFSGLKINNIISSKCRVLEKESNPFDEYFKFTDSIENNLISKLIKIKPDLNENCYNVLEADIKGVMLFATYNGLGNITHKHIPEILGKYSNTLSYYSKNKIEEIASFREQYSLSAKYINAAYNILSSEYDGLVLSNKVSKNLSEKYLYLNKKLGNKLKEPVLTMFIEQDLNQINQEGILLKVMNETYKNSESEYKKYIFTLYNNRNTFKKGNKAPSFSITSINGKRIFLKQFQGKVVYLDFWFNACIPCHILFDKLKKAKEKFKDNKNLVFMSISVDDKETWLNALKKYKYPGLQVYTDNKMRNHEIIKSYKVNSYPTTYLIDKKGNFYSATPPENPKELIALIEEALIEK